MHRFVCITGATSGIGLATAEVFAEMGYSLVIGGRREERLSDVSQALTTKGARAVLALPLDVRSDESVIHFTRQTLEWCQYDLDILVNNAGLVLGMDHVATGRMSDWETVIDTNVMGVMRVTRALLPTMIKNKKGHVVMLGSIAGHQVYEGGSVYCASKHAIKAISQTLRLEVNGTGIRVTSIDPGMVETEFSEVRFYQDKEKAKQVYRGVQPLTGRDIAECIAFATTRPAHVNLDDIIIMPTAQASVGKVHRDIISV